MPRCQERRFEALTPAERCFLCYRIDAPRSTNSHSLTCIHPYDWWILGAGEQALVQRLDMRPSRTNCHMTVDSSSRPPGCSLARHPGTLVIDHNDQAACVTDSLAAYLSAYSTRHELWFRAGCTVGRSAGYTVRRGKR